MRYLASILVLCFAFGVLAQEKKKAAPKLVYPAKTGNVTFDHDAHTKRVKDDCKVCHDKLWPQAKGDLKYKAGMHKPAEAKKTSCGFCHHAGGQSFETKGNCTRCHVKAAAKKG